MTDKRITVFTPTYNRDHLLPLLYASLCRQTNPDFCWMVIDDGSTDNTSKLMENWKAEKKIDILYYYKENGGMHTGHNLAYSKITTELNVCIDSDDFMPEDAIDKILKTWDATTDKTKIAGIIGLDADKNGQIIGTPIPENLKKGTLHDLYLKQGVRGDKKLVLRTDMVKKYPAYPEYQGEKLVPLGILYTLIGQDYDFLYANEVYCRVEYQPEGSTNTIFKQYKQSPRGFAYSRKIQIQYEPGFLNRFKNYIHLVSAACFAKDLSLAFKQVNPLMTIFAFPFGIALTLYIRSKIHA